MIKFEQQPIEGTFLNRYKRFFAEVELPEGKIVAHVPNSGSLKGCAVPGRKCLVTKSADPKRKLPFTLEAIWSEDADNASVRKQKKTECWVGVNTQRPNQLVLAALAQKKVKDWSTFPHSFPEVKISDKSRIDFVLSTDATKPNFAKQKPLKDHRYHFIEVKNVTLKLDDAGAFPDCVTVRGLKHIQELMHLIEQGHTAEFCFVIQRTDIKKFRPAFELDPAYSKALVEAHKQGLQIRCCVVDIDDTGLAIIEKNVPFFTRQTEV